MDLEDFQILKFIGQGAEGKVYAAIHKETKEHVALKQVYQQIQSNQINEISILYGLSHPCILSPTGYFQDSSKSTSYIVFRRCAMDLQQFSQKQLDKQVLFSLFSDVILGCIFLHRKNLIHRDIKAGNVLVRKEFGQARALLTDFGMTRKLQKNQQLTDITGTPYYLAPEIWSGNEYDQKADSWALGVLLYYIMTGKYTVSGTATEQKQQLSEGFIPDYSNLPRLIVSILDKLLVINPQQRSLPEELFKIPALERSCRSRITQEDWDITFELNFEISKQQMILNGYSPLDTDLNIEQIIYFQQNLGPKLLDNLHMLNIK
ncbi:Kinase, NEK [Spironucleus salmonicida]|uniref:Kinase, NEK n=1 Tax=Spironucleus salmonicida TaxID=348837 RepID=V6LGR9_9EUKA|nr:Kinase, NEK [Spironucleus salmonicida]|eukprot:EST43702.1 Kinase, NEK [Spironucleus salmonicida]